MEFSQKGAGVMSTSHERVIYIQRTSAFLLLFSAFLLVEGVVRVISVSGTPDGMWNGSEKAFPPIVLMIGAVVEVSFSMFGVIVASASLLLDARSITTSGALCASILTGWFTFVVYTFAAPGFAASRNPPEMGPLTVSEFRVATAFGEVLASFVYCFVMQGAQFFLALQLLLVQKQDISALRSKSKQKVRLIVYSGFVAFAGFCNLLLGALLRSKAGSGEYMMPQVFPPNVVKYPELTILSGLLIVVYGLEGVAVAVTGKPSIALFASMGCVTWVYLIGAHILGQLGLVGGMVAGPAAQLTVLSTSLIFMPLYLASELVQLDASMPI